MKAPTSNKSEYRSISRDIDQIDLFSLISMACYSAVPKEKKKTKNEKKEEEKGTLKWCFGGRGGEGEEKEAGWRWLVTPKNPTQEQKRKFYD